MSLFIEDDTNIDEHRKTAFVGESRRGSIKVQDEAVFGRVGGCSCDTELAGWKDRIRVCVRANLRTFRAKCCGLDNAGVVNQRWLRSLEAEIAYAL